MCDVKRQHFANHNNNDGEDGGMMRKSQHPMIRIESVDENDNVSVVVNGCHGDEGSKKTSGRDAGDGVMDNENHRPNHGPTDTGLMVDRQDLLEKKERPKRPMLLPFSVQKMLDSNSAPTSPLLRRHRTRTFSDRQSCGSPVPRAPPPTFPPPPPSPTPAAIGSTTIQRRRSWRQQRGMSWDPTRTPTFSFDNNENVFVSPASTPTTNDGSKAYLNASTNNRNNMSLPNGNVFDPLRPLSPLPPDLAANTGRFNKRRRPQSLHLDSRSLSSTDGYTASPRTPRRLLIPSSPKPRFEPPPSPAPSVKLRERVRSRCRAPSENNAARSKSADRALLTHRNQIVATTAKNEDEVLGKANKMQLDLILSKKAMEKRMSAKLEETMEKKDNLVGALRRSMNEPRCKDKVKTANREIKQVINSQVKYDPETKRRYYQVRVQLGNYTADVHTTVSGYHVFISGSTEEGPKFTKEINIEFPETVQMDRIDVIQVENCMVLAVPFKYTPPEPEKVDPAEEQGNPNDPANRLGYLEGLFRSMNLPWPPEGATAHYEYLTGRYIGDQKQNVGDLKCDYLFAKNTQNDVNKTSPSASGNSGEGKVDPAVDEKG